MAVSHLIMYWQYVTYNLKEHKIFLYKMKKNQDMNPGSFSTDYLGHLCMVIISYFYSMSMRTIFMQILKKYMIRDLQIYCNQFFW